MAVSPAPAAAPPDTRRRWLRACAAPARLLVVLAAHGAAVALFIGSSDVEPPRPQPMAIEVTLIAPPAPEPEPAPPPPEPVPPPPEPAPPPPKPVPPPPKAKPKPRPAPPPAPTAISEPVEVAPPEPVQAAPAEPAPPPPTPAPPAQSSAPPAPVVRTEARFDAAYLSNPRPRYPRLSRRMGEEGRVLLRVFVAADGSAGEVRLHRSSGHPRLDEAARAAVERWRFEPAKVDGAPVADWVIVPIEFKLEDA